MPEMRDKTDTDTDTDTIDTLRRLTREVEKLNRHRFIAVQNSTMRMLMFQFMRGLAFGLGSVLGATFLVSILAWWLSQFEFLPLIGDWAAQLAEEFKRAASGQSGVNQPSQ